MNEDQAEPISSDVEWIGRRVIGSAISVHRALSPGYKESIYMEALCIELYARELKFEREKPITVIYKGRAIPGQRLDLLVGSVLVVECKVAEGYYGAAYAPSDVLSQNARSSARLHRQLQRERADA